MPDLQVEIQALAAAGASADRDAARAAFARLREALSSGAVRAAEPDPSSPIGWRVNTWVKQGILLGFRFGDTVDASMDHGRWPFYDKDTLPMRKFAAGAQAGVRIVPGGSSVRDGAYIAPGVICMPPMFVNIGAWIGEQSLIDSHALVGSCAQIGARVHISAGAQIGGVIEPVGALPVIVEDDALVGGNTGIYEGAIVKARAVIRGRHRADRIDAGVRPRARPHHQADRGSAARHPRRRGRRARRARGHRRKRPGVGPLARHAGHRQIPRLAHRHAHGARSVDPVALAAPLIDIDSTTGREGEAGAWLAAFLRDQGFSVTEQPVDGARFNVLATLGPPSVVLSTHFDCVPPFFPSRVEGDRLYGRGSCDAKGILAAQVAAVDALRAAG